jgi:hypothetical protein
MVRDGCWCVALANVLLLLQAAQILEITFLHFVDVVVH